MILYNFIPSPRTLRERRKWGKKWRFGERYTLKALKGFLIKAKVANTDAVILCQAFGLLLLSLIPFHPHYPTHFSHYGSPWVAGKWTVLRKFWSIGSPGESQVCCAFTSWSLWMCLHSEQQTVSLGPNMEIRLTKPWMNTNKPRIH